MAVEMGRRTRVVVRNPTHRLKVRPPVRVVVVPIAGRPAPGTPLPDYPDLVLLAEAANA